MQTAVFMTPIVYHIQVSQNFPPPSLGSIPSPLSHQIQTLTAASLFSHLYKIIFHNSNLITVSSNDMRKAGHISSIAFSVIQPFKPWLIEQLLLRLLFACRRPIPQGNGCIDQSDSLLTASGLRDYSFLHLSATCQNVVVC